MEIESKYKISDEQTLKKILEKLSMKGVSFSKEEYHKDVYFKEYGFRTKINGPGSILIRVRYLKNNGCLLTMKKLTEIDGVWDEVETKTEDGAALESIFEMLGMERAVTVEKKRRIGIFNNLEISIDNVYDLGYFIEVSVINIRSIESAKKLIKDFFGKIGLEISKIELRGYPTILLEKQGVVFSVK